MQESGKYLIHASIRTSGVVERSDVVGAIFGQTEGLLGEELDLRDLQDSSKVGRIDVDIESEGGRSYGSLTVASRLDRAETAVLAAALETLERVGPCRAEVQVTDIEDARVAKRRELVGRAADLLAEFESERLTSDQLVEEVRERARVADITEYEGYPAGPRVADSDAIVVVEGRADVRQLLTYGIKNAVAVEGTDVPEAVAALTRERTVTAFLDGDRGGDLILRELDQVGDIDYVAVAPAGRSVEDLPREAVMDALREKVPSEEFDVRDTGETTGGTPADTDGGAVTTPPDRTADPDTDDAGDGPAGTDDAATTEDGADETAATTPETLAEHIAAVVEAGSGRVRLLDESCAVLDEQPAEEAFAAVESGETVPATVVLDGAADQRLLDVAAQRGVGRVIATRLGEVVKQPTAVRVRTPGD